MMHMKHLHLTLDEQQAAYVESRAAASGRSMSAVVREAVDAQRAGDERRRRVEAALAVVGKYRSGLPDLSMNHDEYFVQAIEERIGRR